LSEKTLRVSDERAAQAKAYFLKAVGMELDALEGQLEASRTAVGYGISEVTAGATRGPTYAVEWRTNVFSSQLGKLRDVADPLLIEVIHFYGEFGVLDQVRGAVNAVSAEFTAADASSGERDKVRPRLLIRLKSLHEKLEDVSEKLMSLKAKLQVAQQ
ncbi:MAG TPA: hypothetical protein VMU53_13600, partial [Candidatus Sulfotelmatobacter sp.]|nr:hypothetical protein [Candidatus Sulfotelmatobacter sp.]